MEYVMLENLLSSTAPVPSTSTVRNAAICLLELILFVTPALGGALAFIVSNAQDGLVIVDTATNVLVRTIPGVPMGSQVAAHPDGSRAYVAAPTGILFVDLNAPDNVRPLTQ